MWASGFTERFVYFYEVAKSLRFYFGQEKINQNKKFLLRAWRNGNCCSAPPLLIALELDTILKNLT